MTETVIPGLIDYVRDNGAQCACELIGLMAQTQKVGDRNEGSESLRQNVSDVS